MPPITLQTERLYLRPWRDIDLAPFAKMNGDPEVMAYFPKTLSPAESDAMARKCQSLIDKNGWGFWAVSLKDSDTFIGFVGLHQPQDNLPFTPCVEIGWRLQKEYWGQGFATEAATAALKFAFETLNLDEVVSFTACINESSKRVMQRLSMTDSKSNFYHPAIEKSHPLLEHVLYRISKDEWINLLSTHPQPVKKY